MGGQKPGQGVRYGENGAETLRLRLSKEDVIKYMYIYDAYREALLHSVRNCPLHWKNLKAVKRRPDY